MLARFLLPFIFFCCSCEAAAPPAELVDCKIHTLWEFGSDIGGWTPDHNVSDLTVKDGVLSFRTTGHDPWILRTGLEIDASQYRFVGIKMRSSVRGQNQLYFGTRESPGLSEGKLGLCAVSAGDEFQFCEIDLSKTNSWSGTVTTLRLDTVNGTNEVGAEVEIDWIAIYSVPARLTIGRPYAGVDAQGVFINVPVSNTGGEIAPGGTAVRSGDVQEALTAIGPGETQTAMLRLPDKPMAARLAVVHRDRPVARVQVIAGVDSAATGEIANETSAVVFDGAGTAKLYAVQGGDRVLMGEFRPLGTLAVKLRDGSIHYTELLPRDVSIDASKSTAKLTALGVPLVNGSADVTWTFELAAGRTDGRITCELTGNAPAQVVRFEGPRLLAGEGSFGASKTAGLFPGLEYLEENEPSSAVKHIGPKLADRHVPHPYKITVPVMAVESSDGVVGLGWDPLGEWAPGRKLPSAEFESPNTSTGAANSLMTVFVPSVPDYVPENAEFAERAYALKGDPVRIETFFFARAGKDIASVIPDYYREHGTPKPPPIAHGVEGTIDLCFKAYTESLYFPEQKGWKTHFGIQDKVIFRPNYAANILAESLRTGNPELARKCGIDANAQLSQFLGTSLDWTSPGVIAHAQGIISRMSPDGGIPYSMTPEIAKKLEQTREASGSDEQTLGDIGQTNSGLTVREINALTAAALGTGRKDFTEAAVRGLAKVNRFRVPRGAQTWEVHAHAPDVYAAGLAVDANILGYQLTGDSAYLDAAVFWARTGLPFVYAWAPPIDPVPEGVFLYDDRGEPGKPIIVEPGTFYTNTSRIVNPGATIAVFGTSFFVANWFGTPVQWCGQAWANSVQRLMALRPDPALQAAADMVFASATQQQLDKGFLAGTYPDSWNLMTNTANMAFIAPDLILGYAYPLAGEKPVGMISRRGFDVGGSRACLNTWAEVERLDASSGRVEATLRFYGGQDAWVQLVPVDAPESVRLDGGMLAAEADLRAAPGSGYSYDGASRALDIKYRVPSRTAQLSVNFDGGQK